MQISKQYKSICTFQIVYIVFTEIIKGVFNKRVNFKVIRFVILG